MTAVSEDTHSKLIDKIKEESELIAIFVLFLAVLIGHETLIEIHEKAHFSDVLKAWLVLLSCALIFFVFVFRAAIRHIRRDVAHMIDERLGPVSRQLNFAVRNIEEGGLHDVIRDAKYLVPESKVMQLEESVTKAVWVVSPDFRYELGDSGDANYIAVISKNIANGVTYNYFVPHDGTTSTYVQRFQSALRKCLTQSGFTDQDVKSALERVTIVSLSADRYPPTAIFGCALYEVDLGDLAFVEYFPRGSATWNIVFRDGNAQGTTRPPLEVTTEVRGTILLKERLEGLFKQSITSERVPSYDIRYFQNAA